MVDRSLVMALEIALRVQDGGLDLRELLLQRDHLRVETSVATRLGSGPFDGLKSGELPQF